MEETRRGDTETGDCVRDSRTPYLVTHRIPLCSAFLSSPATDQLTQLEARPQYSLCLLQLLAMPTLQDVSVKQASAIAFKNFILRCWSYEDSERQEKGQPDMIIPADRQLIKAHLIPLMVSQPKTIQTQLGHALAIISRHDFPKKWETLLPELVGRFKEADSKPEELLGVLEVMHSIFYRYRIELKSQALWEEIEIVLKQVCDPLSELFLRWVTRVSEPAHSNNPQTLPIIIGILSVIVENFYSLNSQEIAAQFEEQSTKQLWFRSMLELLKYTNPILEPQRGKGDIDDPTKLDTLKATICDIINLFVGQNDTHTLAPSLSSTFTDVSLLFVPFVVCCCLSLHCRSGSMRINLPSLYHRMSRRSGIC